MGPSSDGLGAGVWWCGVAETETGAAELRLEIIFHVSTATATAEPPSGTAEHRRPLPMLSTTADAYQVRGWVEATAVQQQGMKGI